MLQNKPVAKKTAPVDPAIIDANGESLGRSFTRSSPKMQELQDRLEVKIKQKSTEPEDGKPNLKR